MVDHQICYSCNKHLCTYATLNPYFLYDRFLFIGQSHELLSELINQCVSNHSTIPPVNYKSNKITVKLVTTVTPILHRSTYGLLHCRKKS